MSIGIYKIENLINGKIYIGQSIHIEKRWQEHCKASSNSLTAKSIQKYGTENFSFQIIEETNDIALLNQLEAQYIKYYNSLAPNGYNIILYDENEHHNFSKYTPEILHQIVNLLKNSNLSFKEIALLYDLDVSMIYYLNRGDYHTLSNETYPLREVKDCSKKEHYCVDCGCRIHKESLRCIQCDHKRQYKVNHPSREELKNLIRNKPFIQIAKQFNVSDNTIRKWCKKENLPFRSSDIKKYTDEEWKAI